MTNIIKTRNAPPAPFGSLDQLFPNKVSTLLDDALNLSQGFRRININ
jgi:hypothetical protein